MITLGRAVIPTVGTISDGVHLAPSLNCLLLAEVCVMKFEDRTKAQINHREGGGQDLS